MNECSQPSGSHSSQSRTAVSLGSPGARPLGLLQRQEGKDPSPCPVADTRLRPASAASSSSFGEGDKNPDCHGTVPHKWGHKSRPGGLSPLRGSMAVAGVRPGSQKAPRPPPLLQKPPGGRVTTVTATGAGDFPGGSTEQGLVAESPGLPPKCQTLINLTARLSEVITLASLCLLCLGRNCLGLPLQFCN